MTDYTQLANFTAKDQLPSGTGGAKIIRGTEWDAEFAAISTAVISKLDSGDLSDQATAIAGASNTTLSTPLRTNDYIRGNSLMMGILRGRLKSQSKQIAGLEVNVALAISAAIQNFTIRAGKTYAVRGMIKVDAGSVNTNMKYTASQTPQIFQLMVFNVGSTTLAATGIQAHDTTFLQTAGSKYMHWGVIRGHATLDSTLAMYHGNGISSILDDCAVEVIPLD